MILRAGQRSVDLLASLDTGASSCLFESGYAAELGLDLVGGAHARFRTANSNFDAYGQKIQVEVLGITVSTLVYSFAEPTVRRNVLGRRGWLDRVRVGVVDYDRKRVCCGPNGPGSLTLATTAELSHLSRCLRQPFRFRHIWRRRIQHSRRTMHSGFQRSVLWLPLLSLQLQ